MYKVIAVINNKTWEILYVSVCKNASKYYQMLKQEIKQTLKLTSQKAKLLKYLKTLPTTLDFGVLVLEKHEDKNLAEIAANKIKLDKKPKYQGKIENKMLDPIRKALLIDRLQFGKKYKNNQLKKDDDELSDSESCISDMTVVSINNQIS